MRIDGDVYGSPLFGRRPVRPISGGSGGRRPPSTSRAAPREVSPLMAKLHEIPEVRPEVLDEVRQRLHRGELMTREAAEATAAAILADLQSFLNA